MVSRPLMITSNFTAKVFLEPERHPHAQSLWLTPNINIMQMDQLIPGNILAVFVKGVVTITRAWEIIYVLVEKNASSINHSKNFACIASFKYM